LHATSKRFYVNTCLSVTKSEYSWKTRKDNNSRAQGWNAYIVGLSVNAKQIFSPTHFFQSKSSMFLTLFFISSCKTSRMWT